MKNGKYVILQGDGMGDYPIKDLDGKTPLEAASTPAMDALAKRGNLGLVRTIPKGMKPGSDVGNMSILGYDPKRYYTGRAPFEAAGIEIKVNEGDVAFRCNLVKLGQEDTTRYMEDYSAGHISTPDAKKLIAKIDQKLGSEEFRFYSGTGYRHLMIWKNGKADLNLTPPHDISGKEIKGYLPKGDGGEKLTQLIKKSWKVLHHPKTNSIWLWGCGKPPSMYSIKEKYSLSGFVISAVDLVKGLGYYGGLTSIDVPGATGFIDTNYSGKVEACLETLERKDFGFVHVEAPDEAGHLGDLEMKLKAIEDFDQKVVGPIWDGLEKFANFSLLVITDHYTPLSLKTHSREAVPFVIYRNNFAKRDESREFNEKSANNQGFLIEEGYRLFENFINKNQACYKE